MPLGLEGIEMPCPVQNDNVDWRWRRLYQAFGIIWSQREKLSLSTYHLRSQLEMEKKHGR